MSNFDLDQLRTFVEVARQGTFRAAGRALGRSQASVTQHMQRLEAVAGRALFRRDGRGKQLTEQGRRLLQYAREILAINDDAMLSMRADGPSGSLRIGSPHDVADTLLTLLLGQLARFMPNLNLEIVVGRSPALLASLQEAQLDLTLATRDAPGLQRVLIRTSPILWLCANHFQRIPGEPLPLILGDEGSVFRQVAVRALDEAGLPWRQAYYSANPIGVKAAVRAGLGITPRSLELLSPDLKTVGDKEGLPRLPDVSYYLYMRPHTVNPLARQAFAVLANALGPQPAPG